MNMKIYHDILHCNGSKNVSYDIVHKIEDFTKMCFVATEFEI